MFCLDEAMEEVAWHIARHPCLASRLWMSLLQEGLFALDHGKGLFG